MTLGSTPEESELDKLFHDNRPLDDLPFAADVAGRVRTILANCGCAVADDINTLGCTGVAGVYVSDVIETITFLRLGLAGCGHGLPCFVPPTLFCLGHNTIGGLQQGQLARHPEAVAQISRPLTDIERANNALVDNARRRGRKDPDQAADILQGREDLDIDVGGETPALEEQPAGAPVAGATKADLNALYTRFAWKCQDHAETNWACRYCVAQAVVDGPVEPTYLVTSEVENLDHEVEDREHDNVNGSTMAAHIATCETAGCTSATIFVRAATFTRKLARD
jgi:hypothetical protein